MIEPKKIQSIEGFTIAFWQNGRDSRGDRKNIPGWPYTNASPQDMTVGEWKEKFKQVYPGFDVKVFDQAGKETYGQTKLKNIRN